MNENQSKIKSQVFLKNLHKIAHHWQWYLGLGVLLVTTGFLAIAFATFTTLLSVIFLGSLLLINGILEIFQAWKIKDWSNLFLHLAIGILYSVVGIFMFIEPVVNAITLTLLLSIFFIIGGLFRIIFSLTQTLANWGWLLLSGSLTLILGILIWQQWPSSGLWILGLFVGIDMIFSGWAWIILSLQAWSLRDKLENKFTHKDPISNPNSNDREDRNNNLQSEKQKAVNNLIKACNDCILACQKCIKKCTECQEKCELDIPNCPSAEDCAATCQDVIDACYKCIHTCNALIENEKIEKSEKQQSALFRCREIAEECAKRAKTTIDRILNESITEACRWPIEICNDCITACDECIESFGKNK